MNEVEYVRFVLRRHVAERKQQHQDNVELWQNGTLTPTEPDEEERIAVIRELKAAIMELELMEQILAE